MVPLATDRLIYNKKRSEEPKKSLLILKKVPQFSDVNTAFM